MKFIRLLRNGLAAVIPAAFTLTTGTTSATSSRQPIIAKMQVLYSVVGHYSSIADRESFYNTKGAPSGNLNYVVPFIVYEPIVTIYNPYNEPLQITNCRVHMADPPVILKFKKGADYLRSEWQSSGTGQGIARFQISNESSANARKSFTMVLTDMSGSRPGQTITLKPGEAKTCSTWVETNWTWGLETIADYAPRSFYDWNATNDFTNTDKRTNNLFGIQCVPGWDFRAGFQTDNLSYSVSGRPNSTLYDFEISNNWIRGWVAIKKGDSFGIEAEAGRTSGTAASDFQLWQLRGATQTPLADSVRRFTFSLAGMNKPSQPVSRTYDVANILQTSYTTSSGGKSPVALFSIIAKVKALQSGKFLAQSPTQMSGEGLYETSLISVNAFQDVPMVGPSDVPTAGITLLGHQRSGDSLILDIAAPKDAFHSYKVKGSRDLAHGFTDDLTSVATIMEGPPNSGISKVTVNVADRGPRYFVRVEL